MEDRGFEPLHAFTRLTVFKTVPFSRTWVIFRFFTGMIGFEPMTSWLTAMRSTAELHAKED